MAPPPSSGACVVAALQYLAGALPLSHSCITQLVGQRLLPRLCMQLSGTQPASPGFHADWILPALLPLSPVLIDVPRGLGGGVGWCRVQPAPGLCGGPGGAPPGGGHEARLRPARQPGGPGGLPGAGLLPEPDLPPGRHAVAGLCSSVEVCLGRSTVSIKPGSSRKTGVQCSWQK